MSIGVGIFLFVVGAILAFALDVSLPGVEGNTLGYILMLAGMLVAALSYLLATQRRRHDTVSVSRDSAGNEAVTERRTESGGGPTSGI